MDIGQGSVRYGAENLQFDQSQLREGFDIEMVQCPECLLKSWRNHRCYFCETDDCKDESDNRTPSGWFLGLNDGKCLSRQLTPNQNGGVQIYNFNAFRYIY